MINGGFVDIVSKSWIGVAEIQSEFDGWNDGKKENLSFLHAFGRIMRGGLFLCDVDDILSMAKDFSISSHADYVIGLDQTLGSIDCDLQKIVCLISLYHHDFMIDLDEIDGPVILDSLGKLIKERKIFLPSRFGRSLYDKYNENYSEKRDFLDFQDTIKLVEGSEQGVYQLGRVITGPLGIVFSVEHRYFPPSTTVPLWHCSDVGCNHLHEVRLKDDLPEVHDAIARLEAVAHEYLGDASRWGSVLQSYDSNFYSDSYGDVLIILHEALDSVEVRELFVYLLSESEARSVLWDVLKGVPRSAKGGSGDPRSIAEKLSDGIIFQTILTLSDRDIVLAIDELVSRKVINVPATEVRQAKQRRALQSYNPTVCSISSLGIRTDKTDEVRSTAVEIWTAHKAANRLADLAWKAGRVTGSATPSIILHYLRTNSPLTTISEMVLGTQEVAEAICERVLMKPDFDNQEHMPTKMLWKLGFDLPRHEGEYRSILRFLDEFRDLLMGLDEPLSRQDRENIRSIGVNLFVELERFVEIMVGYNIWLFSGDHYSSKFEFNIDDAVSSVPGVLGNIEPFTWNPAGGNTFSVLLSYLNASAEWLASLAQQSPTPRARSSYPHYADPEDEFFPFHSASLWGDVDNSELQQYSKNFGEAASYLLKSDLASVRNGIDHYRQPGNFPSVEKMIACESRVRQAIEFSRARRLIPINWWLESRVINNAGQIVELFVNEYGQKYEALYPGAFKGIREGYFGEAVVIPGGKLLNQFDSPLMFSVMEKSSFTAKWENYPYRAV